MKSELQLQAECFQWFHNNYCLNGDAIIFAVPNGGKRNPFEAQQLKASGVVAGVSDLIILRKNEAIFLELKTEKGVISPAQKKFKYIVENLGFKHYYIRDFETFKKILT